MAKDCSLIYQFLHENYMLKACCVHTLFFVFVLTFKTIYVHKMFWACSFHVRTGKSMNNFFSYCGLTDARMRASEKDLPVEQPPLMSPHSWIAKPCSPGFKPSRVPSIMHVSESDCVNRTTPCKLNLCKDIVIIRTLMGSTDQADPSYFYFRISWILMEWLWFYFFLPVH